MTKEEKYKIANTTNKVVYKEGTKGWWSNTVEGILYCEKYPKENKQYECEFVCNSEKDYFLICRNDKLGEFACQYFYPIGEVDD